MTAIDTMVAIGAMIAIDTMVAIGAMIAMDATAVTAGVRRAVVCQACLA